MDVKFINTTSTKLNSLAISNGQLIALSDKPGLSYDLGGVRKSITFSDNYTSSAGTAASGVAASSYALAAAYNNLNTSIQEVTYSGYSNNIVVLNYYNTQETEYTIPCNGIVRLHIGWGTGAYARAWISLNADSNDYMFFAVSNPGVVTGTDQWVLSASSRSCAVPVFKGQRIFTSNSSVSYGEEVVTFIPYLQ